MNTFLDAAEFVAINRTDYQSCYKAWGCCNAMTIAGLNYYRRDFFFDLFEIPDEGLKYKWDRGLEMSKNTQTARIIALVLAELIWNDQYEE
jgi:hypothetical protein